MRIFQLGIKLLHREIFLSHRTSSFEQREHFSVLLAIIITWRIRLDNNAQRMIMSRATLPDQQKNRGFRDPIIAERSITNDCRVDKIFDVITFEMKEREIIQEELVVRIKCALAYKDVIKLLPT